VVADRSWATSNSTLKKTVNMTFLASVEYHRCEGASRSQAPVHSPRRRFQTRASQTLKTPTDRYPAASDGRRKLISDSPKTRIQTYMNPLYKKL
jgi:hypothetical protein